MGGRCEGGKDQGQGADKAVHEKDDSEVEVEEYSLLELGLEYGR